MFTGMIEHVGTVVSAGLRGKAMKLEIEAGFVAQDARVGDSLSVNGACLTATSVKGDLLSFDVSAETLEKTTLARFAGGKRVNLERAVKAGQRLGGHYVQGHVDGRGRVLSLKRAEGGGTLEVSLSPDLRLYVVPKGSIALDGVSLTVAALSEASFAVALIPETLGVTTLGKLVVGDEVNLETDVLGKYVIGYLESRTRGEGSGKGRGLDLDLLSEHGFL